MRLIVSILFVAATSFGRKTNNKDYYYDEDRKVEDYTYVDEDEVERMKFYYQLFHQERNEDNEALWMNADEYAYDDNDYFQKSDLETFRRALWENANEYMDYESILRSDMETLKGALWNNVDDDKDYDEVSGEETTTHPDLNKVDMNMEKTIWTLEDEDSMRNEVYPFERAEQLTKMEETPQSRSASISFSVVSLLFCMFFTVML